MIWKNWNKRITCVCNNIYYPKTENEIIKIVKKSSKVRVIGNGKSTHDITTCDENIINMIIK